MLLRLKTSFNKLNNYITSSANEIRINVNQKIRRITIGLIISIQHMDKMNTHLLKSIPISKLVKQFNWENILWILPDKNYGNRW